MLQAIYILIIERKRLIKMTWWRQALLVLTWPLFDVLEVPTKLIALFKDVKCNWQVMIIRRGHFLHFGQFCNGFE